MPAMMVYNFGAAILRAVGDTRRPLFFLLIAGVVNVGLNLFFVCIFHMGVAGVALATVISQCISAALVVLLPGAQHRLLQALPQTATYLPGQAVGNRTDQAPAGIQGAVFSVSNVLIQSSINTFGYIAVAGNTAASNIEGFVYLHECPVSGVSQLYKPKHRGAEGKAHRSRISAMPWLRRCCRCGAQRTGAAVRPAASGHLFYRCSGHRIRHEPDECRMSDLFSVRHHGRYLRLHPWAGIFRHAYHCVPGRSVRACGSSGSTQFSRWTGRCLSCTCLIRSVGPSPLPPTYFALPSFSTGGKKVSASAMPVYRLSGGRPRFMPVFDGAGVTRNHRCCRAHRAPLCLLWTACLFPFLP